MTIIIAIVSFMAGGFFGMLLAALVTANGRDEDVGDGRQ